MQKLSRVIFLSLSFLAIMFLSPLTYAMLSMELTQGVMGAIPISIVPFTTDIGSTPLQDVSGIISSDLSHSGRFKVYAEKNGIDNVVTGRLKRLTSDHYEVNFELHDMLRGNGKETIVLSKHYNVTGSALRALAHHISDLIYSQITGTRGVFSTKLAYIVVEKGTNAAATHYILEVSDQDGYNPRPLLTSLDPIMSPAWSPDGKQIAYVSFENRHAGIYIENVVTGERYLLSEFPGINGAPAWSPDGKKLALVLSKSGSPNIYMMDVATRTLTQLTHDYYINTEPAFAPDGRSLLFTSNRSGGVQIYQLNFKSNHISRLTYDGNYNARASYSPDGRHVTLIHRVANVYSIALLDLDTGTMQVLTSSKGDSNSPSMAPNGSMILYNTLDQDQNLLAIVSVDGHVQLRLPSRVGEAEDPAWSPYLG
jgi:TolB protein